ncbi:hypothetical protein GGI42DRAFT_319789 [Trichoderma sp. SZMC 28013]
MAVDRRPDRDRTRGTRWPRFPHFLCQGSPQPTAEHVPACVCVFLCLCLEFQLCYLGNNMTEVQIWGRLRVLGTRVRYVRSTRYLLICRIVSAPYSIIQDGGQGSW